MSFKTIMAGRSSWCKKEGGDPVGEALACIFSFEELWEFLLTLSLANIGRS
jgi:hypothetical protein